MPGEAFSTPLNCYILSLEPILSDYKWVEVENRVREASVHNEDTFFSPPCETHEVSFYGFFRCHYSINDSILT